MTATANSAAAVGRQDMICPTCGARQDPADRCRRCQCDLTLLQAVHRDRDRLRRRTLAYLKQRRIGRATAAARECYRLSPDPDTTRLLAVCYAMQSKFADALRLSQRPHQASSMTSSPRAVPNSMSGSLTSP